MQINSVNNTNAENKFQKAKTVSFGRRPLDYTYSRPGTYLPRNEEVFVSDDTVLLLGGEGAYDGYVLGLGGENLKNAFKYKRDDDVITVGRLGNVKIPDVYSDVARQHLEIKHANGGYIVKDISKFGTKISKYRDYSSKAPGVVLPKGLEVLVGQNAVLNLGKNTQIDFSDYSTKRILDMLKPGRTYTLGREGDMTTGENDLTVSKKHIEITKLNNYFVIRDISANGTTIGGRINSRSQNGYYGREQSYQYQQQSQNNGRYGREQYGQSSQSSQSNRSGQSGQYGQYGQYNQYQRQQRSSYGIPPKQPQQEQREKFDCSESCQRDLEELFKPMKKLRAGEKLPPEVSAEMKKQFRELAKKYHPDLSAGNDRDFKEIQNQCKKKGLIDDRGHWIK